MLTESAHQGLVGQQYSLVSSIFYFGYLVWAYPNTLLIARLPTAKYLAANTLFWGAVVALTAACTNFGGLMAVRFLLGVAEATITPAFMFITSTWYTRDEIPTRTGMWFAGNVSVARPLARTCTNSPSSECRRDCCQPYRVWTGTCTRTCQAMEMDVHHPRRPHFSLGFRYLGPPARFYFNCEFSFRRGASCRS